VIHSSSVSSVSVVGGVELSRKQKEKKERER